MENKIKINLQSQVININKLLVAAAPRGVLEQHDLPASSAAQCTRQHFRAHFVLLTSTDPHHVPQPYAATTSTALARVSSGSATSSADRSTPGQSVRPHQ